VDGKTYALDDFENAKVLVVFFTCNHCPYVIGSEDRILALHDAYHPKGVDWVGINSSETQNHPTDDFGHMKQRAAEKGIRYPYLRDESQEVARSCDAPRTPHFYVFDADRRLRYTGRLDDRPRDASAASTHELRDAPDAVPPWQDPPVPRTNPIGCNVKWRGKEEHWMPPEACDLVQAVSDKSLRGPRAGGKDAEAGESRRFADGGGRSQTRIQHDRSPNWVYQTQPRRRCLRPGPSCLSRASCPRVPRPSRPRHGWTRAGCPRHARARRPRHSHTGSARRIASGAAAR